MYITVQFLLWSVATTLPDERVRYWNGYMLFYEKMEEPAKTPVSAKKSKIQTRKAILEGGWDMFVHCSYISLFTSHVLLIQ